MAMHNASVPRKSIWLLTRWSGVRKEYGLPVFSENPREPALTFKEKDIMGGTMFGKPVGWSFITLAQCDKCPTRYIEVI